MSTQKIAMVFGVVMLVVGLLGFVPGITTADGHLLGIFEVDTLHNIVHILTGILALVFMKKNAKMFFKVFGVVYLLVTIVGFVMGGNILGLFMVNMADNVLHLIIAALALFIGFKKESGMAMPM